MAQSSQITDQVDPLITDEAFEKLLNLKRGHGRAWRSQGKGPKYLKLGGRIVRYRMSDVQAWLASSTIVPAESAQ